MLPASINDAPLDEVRAAASEKRNQYLNGRGLTRGGKRWSQREQQDQRNSVRTTVTRHEKSLGEVARERGTREINKTAGGRSDNR